MAISGGALTPDERTLHDCFDCEGCICEEWCEEEDEKEFSGFLTEGDD